VGDWSGWLSNSGERLTLVDAAGVVVDSVEYADEGDWSVRELGPTDMGHRGWQWSDQTDGGGKSLELINAAQPNEFAQNWAASLENEGTPGRANSVAASDLAPIIVDARHSPLIPKRRRFRHGHGPCDRRIHSEGDGSTAISCGTIPPMRTPTAIPRPCR
jgi:hypothetical protein